MKVLVITQWGKIVDNDHVDWDFSKFQIILSYRKRKKQSMILKLTDGLNSMRKISEWLHIIKTDSINSRQMERCCRQTEDGKGNNSEHSIQEHRFILNTINGSPTSP